jgi:hypothetical protein
MCSEPFVCSLLSPNTLMVRQLGQVSTVMIEMKFIVGSLSSLQPTDERPLPSAGNDWPIRQTPQHR